MPGTRICYSQENMRKAIAACKGGVSINRSAKIHGIPRMTLSDKVKGKTPVGIKLGRPANLSKEEEAKLVQWIHNKRRKGYLVKKSDIMTSVQEMIKSNPSRVTDFINGRPGESWFKAFLKRNPSVSSKRDDDNETTVPPEINISNPENQTYEENSVPQDVTPVPIEEQESYKLQHENHDFLVLKSLSEDESFMDVTLTAQGKPIKAHKSVLSAMSQYFKNVLKANPSPHPIIVMPLDITFQELKNIIGYIYRGETTMEPSDLKSFLKAADALQVMGLISTEADAICAHVQETPQAPPTVSPPSKCSRKKKRKRIPSDSESDHSPDGEEMLTGQGELIMVKEELNDEVQNHQEILLNETPEFEPAPSLKNESMTKRQILAQFSFPSTSSAGGRVTVNNGDSVITEILPFQCPYCYQLHRPKQKMQFHLGLEHPNRNSYMCKCARVFTTTNLLSSHEKKCAVLLKKKMKT